MAVLLAIDRLWPCPSFPLRPVVDDTDVLDAIAEGLAICITEAPVPDGVIKRFELTIPWDVPCEPGRW